MSDLLPGTQSFLDTIQYSNSGILKYERIFGHTFVSAGGLRTAEELCALLPLSAGCRVLDIGVGSGGPAILMAEKHNCHVTGVDLSTNMIKLAQHRRDQLPSQLQSLLEFCVADITTSEIPAGSFDVVHSRDTILHIEHKSALFGNIYSWLKPGGHLIITDYCRGDKSLSADFLAYKKQRGYHLNTVSEYRELVRSAGFRDVIALDRSRYFLQILQRELTGFQTNRDSFLQEFGERDYQEIFGGWQEKISRVKEGSQVWLLLQAVKAS